MSGDCPSILEGSQVDVPEGWQVSTSGDDNFSWHIFECLSKRLPTQGWKVHVSASAFEAVRLLRLVTPFFFEHGITFKYPGSIEAIARLNSGEYGPLQAGKVLTIYPRDSEQATALVEHLKSLWPVSNGPIVLSDLHIRSAPAISLRYGIFTRGEVIVDSSGRYHFALSSPTGQLEPDERRIDGKFPAWAPPPPFGDLVAYSFHGDGILTIGPSSYIKVAVLQNGPAGTVYLGASLSACESVVIKTTRRGVGGDKFGTDRRDRLINERNVLSAICWAGISPRPFEVFDGEEIGLVVEYIDGKSVSALPQSEQRLALPLLAMALHSLHTIGFAHLDIKLGNALWSSSKGLITLVDYELSAPIGSPRNFFGGTRGYIPPEGHSPMVSGSADIFALGVCVAHTYLGTDPANLAPGAGRLVGLLSALGYSEVASLVLQLTDKQPSRRPSAQRAASLIDSTQQNELGSRRPKRLGSRRGPDKNWCRRVAQEAACYSRSFRSESRVGAFWRNTHIHSQFQCEAINLGAAGIVLGLLTISKALGCGGFEADIEAGCEWLSAKNVERTTGGLFTGDAGVALALAVAGRRFQSRNWIGQSETRLRAANCSEEKDLFTGDAGLIWSACIIADVLKQSWPLEVVRPAAMSLLDHCRHLLRADAWVTQPVPVSSELLLGAAHGVAGIAMAVAAWGRTARSAEATNLAIDLFRRIVSHSRSNANGSFPRSIPYGIAAPGGQWCHGIAGLIWCMIQAFDSRCGAINEELDWAVEQFTNYRAIDNASYCHGLAGQLELCRMLSSFDRYRTFADRRAEEIVAMLRLTSIRMDGLTVWPSDNPTVITPDLWIGFLAPASALALYAGDYRAALLSPEWLSKC